MKIVLVLMLSLPLFGNSQVNNSTWGVADTIITLSKTTDFGPVHDYIELFNNSGQDLQMRWICLEPTSWPSLWITNFNDPDNSYTDVQNSDSADFILLNPPVWANKLIIGVEHQSFAFTDTVSFKVWPVNFPEDSLTLYYVIEIAQGNTWASIDENDFSYEYFLDLDNQTLKFEGTNENVSVIINSLSGQLVYSASDVSLINSEPIDLSGCSNQLLIVNLISDSNEISSFKIRM